MPVFWLFCFEAGDLTDVALDGEQVPTLTAPLSAVRERLATRDAVAREWFPGFAGLWGKWRQAIGGLGQQFLKLDSYVLSCMGDHRDFASGLFMALDGEKGTAQFSAPISLNPTLCPYPPWLRPSSEPRWRS